MKTLLIMRHAKSSWADKDLPDHERPLNARGKIDAPRMGELLNAEDLIPEAILCSTAKRAKSTAKLLVESVPFEGEITTLRDFYHGGPEDFIDALSDLPDEVDVAMIVGHNPDLEYFLDVLTDASERMPTAAIAYVELPIDAWDDLDEDVEGDLVEIWRPKEV
ncbi:MAG: histidine phosphatase family protein [Anaerolineales bacterium]|nr:histidine phosphatase family protein [Anaerolineales bacterium]